MEAYIKRGDSLSGLFLVGCWFIDKGKPALPQHPYCHCTTDPIPFSSVMDSAKAECDIRKFSEYIFSLDMKKSKGKKVLFESWGYSILDSERLKNAFERQALEKYVLGKYVLGNLDEEGQRINIEIELKRKDSNVSVTFISGWMVYPNGKIKLTTPYGKK